MACWVPGSNGSVPPQAFVGGEDNNSEAIFVARAFFNGAVIPGKLVPSHGVCYIAWGGQEHPCSNYEVLCSCYGGWVAADGDNIPPNAVPAGETEDGETLYVGRVVHDDTLTIGKIQASHGVCYIPYGGEEISYGQYEVLVD